MQNISKNTSPTKVIVGPLRLSFVNVAQPRALEGSTPKYSVCMMIPKTDQVTQEKVKGAIRAAVTQGVQAGKFKAEAAKLANFKKSLRDGDTEMSYEEFKGHMFINASTKQRPGVVNQYAQPMDPEQIYSGCYCRVAVNFYPYNVSGNKGVACGLNNIQFVRDGEPLGGAASAESDFAEYAEKAPAAADFVDELELPFDDVPIPAPPVAPVTAVPPVAPVTAAQQAPAVPDLFL